MRSNMYANFYESAHTFAMHTCHQMWRFPKTKHSGGERKQEPLALPLAVEPPAQRSEMADALTEALRTTKERVRAISQDIPAAQKRARRPHASVPVKARCPHTMASAQALYAMTGCMEDVAQAYARQKRVRAMVANPWLDEGFASACAGIDEAERERLLAPVTAEGLRAVAAARQYLVEHWLVQWVAHQHVTKRIAPTPAVAAQELVTPSAPLGL